MEISACFQHEIGKDPEILSQRHPNHDILIQPVDNQKIEKGFCYNEPIN